eukprot:gene10972-464_t
MDLTKELWAKVFRGLTPHEAVAARGLNRTTHAMVEENSEIWMSVCRLPDQHSDESLAGLRRVRLVACKLRQAKEKVAHLESEIKIYRKELEEEREKVEGYEQNRVEWSIPFLQIFHGCCIESENFEIRGLEFNMICKAEMAEERGTYGPVLDLSVELYCPRRITISAMVTTEWKLRSGGYQRQSVTLDEVGISRNGKNRCIVFAELGSVATRKTNGHLSIRFTCIELSRDNWAGGYNWAKVIETAGGL